MWHLTARIYATSHRSECQLCFDCLFYVPFSLIHFWTGHCVLIKLLEQNSMVGRETIARSMHHVQPVWSTSRAEARSRAIMLYKTWFREIPHIGKLNSYIWYILFCLENNSKRYIFSSLVDDYNLPPTIHQCRAKLRAEFSKHKHLTDIRQIDTLVMKHQLELKDICCMEKDRSHILCYWAKDNGDTSHRTQFLDKFLVGQN